MANFYTADQLLESYTPDTSDYLRGYGMQSRPAFPTITPQRERSLLRELGSQLVGGIGAAGALLSVPVDSIHAAIVGKDWTEPWRNPLSPSGRVSGREVLDYWGWTPPNKQAPMFSSDWWKDLPHDIAGFVIGDLAMDPLVWLSTPFGGSSATIAGHGLKSLGKSALADLSKAMTTKAVKQAGGAALTGVSRAAAEKAARVGWREGWLTGTLKDVLENLPDDLSKTYRKSLEGWFEKRGTSLAEHELDALGGTLGIRPPFTYGLSFGRSEPFVKMARAADLLGQKVRYSKPMRVLAGMFDQANLGLVTEEGQRFASEIDRSAAKAVVDARYEMEPVVNEIYQHGWHNPVTIRKRNPGMSIQEAQAIANKHGNAMFTLAETGKTTPQVEADLAMVAAEAPADLLAMKNQIPKMQAQLHADLVEAIDEGMDLDELSRAAGFQIDYMPRQVNMLPSERTAKYGQRLVSTKKHYMVDREPWAREIPTALMNEVSVDPMVAGIARKKVVDTAEWDKLAADLEQKYGAKYTGLAGNINWKPLARWAGHLHPDHARLNIPAYLANPFDAVLRRREIGAQAKAAAQSFHDFTSVNSEMADSMIGGATIHSLLDSTPGMKLDTGARAWMRHHFAIDAAGMPTQNLEMWNELAAKYGPLHSGGSYANAVNWAKGVGVAGPIADEAKRVVRAFAGPDAAGEIVGAYDRFQNWWKKWVTVPWPSFHARNFISGMVRNWVGNGVELDGRNYIDAGKMLFSDTIDGAKSRYFKDVLSIKNDEEATAELRRLIFAHKVHSHKQGFFGLDAPLTGQLGEIPGVTLALPRAMGDKNGVLAATDAITRVGSAGSYYVEGFNRIAPFLKYLREGMSPEAAAQKVAALQVDYDALSSFERNVMRRVFPFYSFQKGVIPFTVGNILARPGGRLAQIPKGVARMRADDPVLPEQVQETAAIRLPSDKAGTQRFLTTMGLMEEQFYGMAMPAFRAFSDPMGAGQEFLREVLSQTSVPIKGVAELFSGRSAYFGGAEPGGRELRSLTPAVGQTWENIKSLMTGQKEAGMARPIGSGIPVFGGTSWPNAIEYAAQSVASRPLSMMRDLTSPEKAAWEKIINALSGLKVYNVSRGRMDAQVAELLREAIVDQGGKKWTMAYVPEEILARMPTAQRLMTKELLDYSRIREKRLRDAR